MEFECTTSKIARFSGELADYDLNTFVEMLTGIDNDLAQEISYRTNVDIMDVTRWIVTICHALEYAHHNSITDKWGITKPHIHTLQDYERNKKNREDKFNAEDILGSAAREMRKREGIEQYPEDFDIAWMFAGEVVSTRMGNCLRNMDIYTPEQLALFSEQDLLKMPNLGRKTLKEIRETLKENNLKLKGE